MTITDAMSLATEVIKSRQGSTPTPTKTVKIMKKESVKQLDNKPQPTPEQLRLAQLINTKKEDPKLKEKLKQVMDATQRTMEEAYLALHDSEFDPNRAVNLLLEGNIETEWSTSSKKKKTRTPGEKSVKNKADNIQEVTQESEPWDSSLNGKPSIGNRGSNLRGRGRNFRGRGNSFQQPEFTDRGRRFNRYNNINNNEERGDNGTDLIQSRTFERVVTPTLRPVDTWDPKRPISSMLNQNRFDNWDEEEYTGSLSSSLVYTSSGTSPQPKSINLPHSTLQLSSETRKPALYENSNIQPIITSSYSTNREQITPTAVSHPTNSLPAIPQQTPVFITKSPSLGANVTKPPPKLEKSRENQEFCVKVTSKPPAMSKVRSKPVEMPPNSLHNNIDMVDIQFGSLDLKDHSEDIPVFSSQSHISQSSKETEPRSCHLNTKNDNASNIFSESICGADSSPPSPSIHKEPSSQVTRITKKPQPISSVYGSSYLSSLVTTSNISTALNQNTYSSPTTGICGVVSSASTPPYQYSNYVTQPSPSVPMLPNLSSSYQNILGNQPYTTNSQTIYGSNVLPTSSYTIPYQTYSSTVQHKPAVVPVPFTGSKDFDPGNHNISLNLASRSGVPTASSMLTTNQNFPLSKGSNLQKSPILSNIPPIMGHQQPLFIGQGAIPYFQPPIYYQDLQVMQQQRLTSTMNAAYYDVGYSSLGRDGAPPYTMNERVLPKHESLSPMQHGNQIMGACVAAHLSSSGDVFGTETDRYSNCEGICENNGSCSDNSEPSNQLIQSGMALIDSTNPMEICSKSISSNQKKINEYD